MKRFFIRDLFIRIIRGSYLLSILLKTLVITLLSFSRIETLTSLINKYNENLLLAFYHYEKLYLLYLHMTFLALRYFSGLWSNSFLILLLTLSQIIFFQQYLIFYKKDINTVSSKPFTHPLKNKCRKIILHYFKWAHGSILFRYFLDIGFEKANLYIYSVSWEQMT